MGKVKRMPKRGENIYKRKDGRWEGRYIKGQNPNGKNAYHSVYGKSYREVKMKLQQQHTGAEKTRLKSGSMTLEKLMETWLSANSQSLKQSSYQRYRFLIEKHIIPLLGDLKLSHLSLAILNQFKEHELTNGRLDGHGGLSPKTVSDIMSIIRSGIRLLTAEHGYENTFIETVKRPSIKLRPVSVLSQTETILVTREIITNPTMTNIAILLSLEAGIRLGEVCALKWNDFDLREGIVRIRRTAVRINYGGKTTLMIQTPKSDASERTVPLTAKATVLLRAASRGKQNDAYILTDDLRVPMEPRTLQYRFAGLLKKLGIQRRGYHVTRHSFATRCIEKGVDPKTLSEILGHSDVKTTLQMYVHPSINIKRQSVELASAICAEDSSVTEESIGVKNMVA